MQAPCPIDKPISRIPISQNLSSTATQFGIKQDKNMKFSSDGILDQSLLLEDPSLFVCFCLSLKQNCSIGPKIREIRGLEYSIRETYWRSAQKFILHSGSLF